jgi:hypothetical protein
VALGVFSIFILASVFLVLGGRTSFLHNIHVPDGHAEKERRSENKVVVVHECTCPPAAAGHGELLWRMPLGHQNLLFSSTQD